VTIKKSGCVLENPYYIKLEALGGCEGNVVMLYTHSKLTDMSRKLAEPNFFIVITLSSSSFLPTSITMYYMLQRPL